MMTLSLLHEGNYTSHQILQAGFLKHYSLNDEQFKYIGARVAAAVRKQIPGDIDWINGIKSKGNL